MPLYLLHGWMEVKFMTGRWMGSRKAVPNRNLERNSVIVTKPICSSLDTPVGQAPFLGLGPMHALLQFTDYTTVFSVFLVEV